MVDRLALLSAPVWAYNGYAVVRAWWLNEPLGYLVAVVVATGCALLTVDALARAFCGPALRPENEKGASGR